MEWIKFTERECDLFTAYCIMIGYLRNYEKNIGKNLKNFLMISKAGIIHSWRSKTEYDDFLAILERKNLEVFEGILDRLNKQNEKLKKFLWYKKLENYNDRDLLKIFKEFVDVYQNYFPLFTLPKYFGMVLDEKKLSKRQRNKLIRMRGIADYEKIQKQFLLTFFKELGKRKKINDDLLFYALPEEIVNLLEFDKKIRIDILKNRKKFVIFLTKAGRKTIIATGTKASRIFKSNIKKEARGVKFIKGKVANRGLVKGIVQIVLRETDLKNLDNKIIVAPMTSIKFVPYLKNIKGIITNEGGIACHAAIISRELNVPCIVNTEVATKILRTGDIVNMDANTGVVKIIKRAKSL